jgi:hypothetical protein
VIDPPLPTPGSQSVPSSPPAPPRILSKLDILQTLGPLHLLLLPYILWAMGTRAGTKRPLVRTDGTVHYPLSSALAAQIFSSVDEPTCFS